MTASRQERDTLQETLRQVLGPGPARTLWNMLPPEQHQLATKVDMQRLEQRMDGLEQRMDGLEQRMDGLEQRMDGFEQRMDGLEHRMDGLEQRMDGLGSLMERFDQRLWDFHEVLRAQTRVYLTATIGSMVGVGALAFAGAAAF